MTTNLPLYSSARDSEPENGKQGHKGLYYERFYNNYNDAFTIDAKKHQTWIDKTQGVCGNVDALLQAACRQVKRCKQLKGASQCFITDWHFVTGLGNAHPVENGFSWHPTLGTPYLAGAAVKGLLRSWLEAWCGFDEKKLAQWFGGEERAGDFIFFDATPVEQPLLATDVMTPHMGNWYAQGDQIKSVDQDPDKIPADWHDPNPIHFLVVRKAALLFSIAPRAHSEQAKIEIKELFQALETALDLIGAGAKTAVGYGRMVESDPHLQKINRTLKDDAQALLEAKREKQLATLSPEARTIAEITQALDDDPAKTKILVSGPIAQRIAGTLKEAIDWPKGSRLEFAELAKRFYGKHVGWGNAKKRAERRALIEKLKATQTDKK